MSRSGYYIVRAYYYYSLALGLFRFEYDFHADRVQLTRRVSFYSLLVTVFMLSLIPQQFQLDVAGYSPQSKARELYQFLYTLMTFTRTGAFVLVQVLYWWRRQEIFSLIAEFQSLRCEHLHRLSPSPLSVRRFRNALLRKFVLFFTCDLQRLAAAWYSPNWQQFATVALIAISLIVLNQVINHLFFSACVANLYLEALNDELRRVMSAVSVLEEHALAPSYSFRKHCVHLLNSFEALMTLRKDLQRFTERVNRVLGAQMACVALNLYLYSVGLAYMIYSLTKPRETWFLNMPTYALATTLFTSLVYFWDQFEFVVACQRLQCNFAAGISIIRILSEQRQLSPLWSRSIGECYLREACRPYRPMIVGLFLLDCPTLFLHISSVISRAIILVQYDYENF